MDKAQLDLDKELRKLTNLTLTRACWLDGSECPYGQPEGQFLLRPRQFCHFEEPSCRKITDNVNDLNEIVTEFQREEIEEEIEKELSALIKESALSLSGEVEAVADCADCEEDEKRKGVLRLAAAIIKEMEEAEDQDAKDPNIVKILRVDDLTAALDELGIGIK